MSVALGVAGLRPSRTHRGYARSRAPKHRCRRQSSNPEGPLMPATVIVGLQWGDEGKGKTTDFLAEQTAMVVRYQGGDNAGHTVVLGDEVFKLHLVPSGILYPHITTVIGPGVVVNPATLIEELDGLSARGIDTSRLRVSLAAHMILPYHRALDAAREARLGGDKVGTTGRGIGPAYEDRAARGGLRMEDLLDEAALRTKLERVLPEKNALLAALGAGARFEVGPLVAQARTWGERLARHIADATSMVQDALREGDHVLLEGAQGTLLDLDHGSYPFVTSSSPIAGGACTGGGIGPLQVDEVMGVMKAYSTRVGSGPFPTELADATGDGIAARGHEVGTTTGRPRRVGWFDAVPLRYTVAVNSVSSIMLNKLDILSGLETIRLCTAYEVDGRRIETWPSSAAVLARATPVYEDFPGWQDEIHGVRALADLPENARRYVTALEEHAGVPIVLVSVGPERSQTIERAWRPMRHRPGAG
jgi:adenylosuccinate synthase